MRAEPSKTTLLRLKQHALFSYTSAHKNFLLNPDNLKYKQEFRSARERLIRYLGYKLVYSFSGGKARWRQIDEPRHSEGS